VQDTTLSQRHRRRCHLCCLSNPSFPSAVN